jgi:N-hydroxyarylamine O-acetyltransferase
MPDEDGYRLEVRLQAEWQPVYTFDLQPQQFVDYQMANWFVSTHPASRFIQTLMVALPAGTRRQTLLDAELGVREPGGTVERRRLGSVGELRLALAGVFGIEVPTGARMDAALQRALNRR